MNKISYPLKFSLVNKTAVITGASGLLGQRHCEALLELGASVVLTDINVTNLEIAKKNLQDKYKNSNIMHLEMDVSSETSILKASDQIYRNKKRVDILINNAAINPTQSLIKTNKNPSRLENFDLTQWDKEIAVGLTGAFLCSKVFGSKMASDHKGGVILNIASDLSVIAPDQRLYQLADLAEEFQPVKPITYSVIKSGLVGLTKYLSTYWLKEGIRANALSPGGVYDGQNEEFVEKLTSLIPLGRMATEDEYIGAIQFLCSDASSYMTGQNIIIDGGRSIW